MANYLRTVILTTALLGLVSSAVAQPTTTNDKIVKFCKDNLGKKVGEGECSHLADAALEYAGAKNDFKDSPKPGDYVWGEIVYTLEMERGSLKETKVPRMSVQPGDVIQFGDAKFEGKDLRGSGNYSWDFPHHTAIVLDVKAADNVLTVFEQNVNGKKIVMENAWRLTDLKTGWIRVYRPVPK